MFKDATDAALHLASNFSECSGADTATLREAWQQVMRSEERAAAALQEAWAATLTVIEAYRNDRDVNGPYGLVIVCYRYL